MSASRSTIKFITVEGNIGSGKSTMIELIRKAYPDYSIVDEPVDIWTNLKDEQGLSLLELFYKDKERWSYTFQNSAFITRLMTACAEIDKAVKLAASSNKDKPVIVISERGILTDRYVFASMLKDSGLLSPIEWKLYTYWFDYFCNDNNRLGLNIDAIIYIQTPFNLCFDRIKKRARQGESNIPHEYLDSLEDYHDKWIDNTSLPVLRITSEASEVSKIASFVEGLCK